MQRPRSWKALARADAGVLKRLQDDALRRFVREELYPFSAHYRRLFDQAGIDPRRIRSIEDLRSLPLTTKQDLIKAQIDPDRKRDFVLVPSPEKIRRDWPIGRKLALVLGGARSRELLRFAYTPNFLTFTTGRSSEPVAFAYTPHDIDLLGEATARNFDVVGVQGGTDRVINLMPFAPHLAFWAVTLGGFRSGCMVLPSGGGKVLGTDGNLRMIERIRATALTGTPGYVYHLLRRANERGADLSSIKHLVLGAEKVPNGLKEKMAQALLASGATEVSITGTYGFTEARMAFGECPTAAAHSSGYHLYPDLGLFEVIDPASGNPVGEGETGELVYTALSGHGTVVCRYRTGDLALGGITWKPCPFCGRTVPRVSSELRRVTDRHNLNLTKIKGTLVDLSHIGTVLSGLPEVEEWQVAIGKKDGDPFEVDTLEVRFSPRNGSDVTSLIPRIHQQILDATEVAPNRITAHTLPQMLEFLGMETELKEKRFLDLRPKSPT